MPDDTLQLKEHQEYRDPLNLKKSLTRMKNLLRYNTKRLLLFPEKGGPSPNEWGNYRVKLKAELWEKTTRV